MRLAKSWFRVLIIMCLLTLLTACGLGRALRAATPTPAPAPEVQVTADQVAQAMQADEFYSDYRGDLLLVSGKVKAVNQQVGSMQIELETNLPTTVVCDLGNQNTSVKPGDQVTVQALAADAERGQAAVLLKQCRIH